jgi:outer membrane murein-binding lipoprotein Lpp
MTRAEELTTKLRTLSYDHERLRAMHGAATETAEGAEREAAAAKAKLTWVVFCFGWHVKTPYRR